MAAGSPELRLGISFDLESFKKTALPSLTQAASNFELTVNIKFGRESINEQMRLLGRQLGQRKYRIDLNDASITSAIAAADKLAGKLANLQKTSGRAQALGSVISTQPAAGGPNIAQLKAIYSAAKELDIVKGAVNRTRKELEADLKIGFASAGQDAVKGLIEGILSEKGSLAGIASSLGDELVNKLEKSLEIASPSKRLARTGRDAGKGFNNGLIEALQESTRNAVGVINASLKRLDRMVELRQRKARAIAPEQPNFELAQRQAGEISGRRDRVQNKAEVLQLRGAMGEFEGGSYQATSRLLQALQLEASEIKPNTADWNRLQGQIAQVTMVMQKADRQAEEIQMRTNLGAFSPHSLASLESRLVILKSRAREIAPNEEPWKELNKEIQLVERSIEKSSRKPLTRGQRVGAAGGAFLYGGGLGGGIGSAVGGVAGGLIGGVPGAFGGAAVGQLVDNLGQSLAGVTDQAAKVQQLQRGLAMASIDAKDFAEAQQAVAATSAKLFLPIEQTTKSFAQLRINTKQYGLSVEETRRILEGTSLAVSSVGGSAEDVDGALRAVVQILSKGGVQAEELRGQLGERFPGAVVKFAQANKLSFEELQKGLESGQIGIKEFVTFAEANYRDYGEFAKKLATAPEFAGRRLESAMEQLGVAFGSLFTDAGANIQDVLAETIRGLTEFIKNNRTYIKQFISDWGSIVGPIVKVIGGLLKALAFFSVETAKIFQSLFANIRRAMGMATIGEARERLVKASKVATNMNARDKQRPGAMSELRAAQKAYKDLGGSAAFAKTAEGANSSLTFGGPGAGMSTERNATEDKTGKSLYDEIEKREESLAAARKEYEEDIADVRRNAIKEAADIERKYQDARVDAARQLARAQRALDAQVAEESFLDRTARIPQTGERRSVIEAERAGGELVQKFTEDRITREEQAQDRQVQLARDLEAFKKTNSDAINQAGERYAKKIGDIQQAYAKAVAKLIEEGSGNGAKQLVAAGKLMAALISRATAQQAVMTATGKVIIPRGPNPDNNQPRYEIGGKVYDESVIQDTLAQPTQDTLAGSASIKAYIDANKDVASASKGVRAAAGRAATSRTPSVAPVVTADLDARVAASGAALTADTNRVDAVNDALNKQENIINGLKKLGDTQLRQGEDQSKALQDQTDQYKKQIAFIQKGMVPALAQQKVEAEDLFDLQKEQFAASVRSAMSSLAASTPLEKRKELEREILGIYNDQLRVIDGNRQAYEKLIVTARDAEAGLEVAKLRQEGARAGTGLRAGFIGDAARAYEGAIEKGFNQEQAQSIAAATKDMGLLKLATNSLEEALGSVGDSFANALKGILAGSSSAQEALAGMFQSIASSFTDMVGKMIAEYLKMTLIKGIMSLLPGAGAAGGGLGSVASNLNQYAPVTAPITMANGGVLSGGFRAFADGGIVTGPTLGLVGEGRYNEAVIPLPDGKSVPVDLGGAMGGQITSNIVVNVSSDGKTSSSGAGSDSAGLGRKLEGAVKQVIVDELRPGGLLTGRR
jgi:tape measure domain-containing protein